MVVQKAPVTFCFTINWSGPKDDVPRVFEAYKAAVTDVLHEAALAAG